MNQSKSKCIAVAVVLCGLSWQTAAFGDDAETESKRRGIATKIEALSLSVKARLRSTFLRRSAKSEDSDLSESPDGNGAGNEVAGTDEVSSVSCRCGQCGSVTKCQDQIAESGARNAVAQPDRSGGPVDLAANYIPDPVKVPYEQSDTAELKRLMRLGPTAKEPYLDPNAASGAMASDVIPAQHQLPDSGAMAPPYYDSGTQQYDSGTQQYGMNGSDPLPPPQRELHEPAYIGSRLPRSQLSAVEHALKLRTENEALKSSQRSMSAASQQLRAELRETQDLLKQTENAMQLAQTQLELAEKRNAELKESIASMESEHMRFASETNRVLNSIQNELDDVLVSEINANE